MIVRSITSCRAQRFVRWALALVFCVPASISQVFAAQGPALTIVSSVPTAFEAGSVEGVFIITRTSSLSEPLTVRLQITGSATNGVDYPSIPVAVQIPAGSATVEIRVRPIDDTESEADELVTIGLADIPTNSESANTRATLVVKDNDTVVELSTQSSGAESGSQPVVFRFTRNGNLRATITVNYSLNAPFTEFGDGSVRSTTLADGSSNTFTIAAITNGADFTPPPLSLTFQVGETIKTLSVTPIDDSVSESRESIYVRLLPSPLYTVGPNGSAIGFIDDNDTSVQITTQNALGAEAGRVPASFRFTRTGDVTVPLTVSYRVDPLASNSSSFSDGSSNTLLTGESGATTNLGAVSGSDLVVLPGTITFQSGEEAKILEVTPIDDAIAEGLESFRITILSSSLYRLGPNNTATASIQDNDVLRQTLEPQLNTVSIQATVSEASEAGPTNGIVTISRTGPLSSALIVHYTVNNQAGGGQPATNGVDFEHLSGQVEIPAGASSTTLTIRPIVDDLNEPQERVVIQLTASSTYTIQGSGQATLRIRDNNSGRR